MQIANTCSTSYPHNCLADNAAYRHYRCADKRCYRHNRRADRNTLNHPKTHQTNSKPPQSTSEHIQTIVKHVKYLKPHIIAIQHQNLIINNCYPFQKHPKPIQRNSPKSKCQNNTPNLLINIASHTKSHPNHLKHPYKLAQKDTRYIQRLHGGPHGRAVKSAVS